MILRALQHYGQSCLRACSAAHPTQAPSPPVPPKAYTKPLAAAASKRKRGSGRGAMGTLRARGPGTARLSGLCCGGAPSSLCGCAWQRKGGHIGPGLGAAPAPSVLSVCPACRHGHGPGLLTRGHSQPGTCPHRWRPPGKQDQAGDDGCYKERHGAQGGRRTAGTRDLTHSKAPSLPA